MQYLVHGSHVVLQRIFYKSIGQKLGLNPPESHFNNTAKKSIDHRKQKNQKRGFNKTDKPHQEQDKGRKQKKPKSSDTDKKKEDISLTQIARQYNFVAHSDSDESSSDKEADEEKKLSKRSFLSPLTLVQSVKVRY